MVSADTYIQIINRLVIQTDRYGDRATDSIGQDEQMQDG